MLKEKLLEKASDIKDFSGLTGAAAGLVLASWAARKKNILVVTSSTKRAQSLISELEFFSKASVNLLPALDIIPGEKIKPSKELVGQRLAQLERLAKGEAGVVVAPIKAIMTKTTARMERCRINVAADLPAGKAGLALPCLIEQLIEFGYRRFDIVGGRGEFSVRGGIIDIFPLNYDQPVRIELSDDTIESIRLFDVYSQRSIKKLDSVSVLPAIEKYEVPLFDHLPQETLIVLVESVELEQASVKHINEADSGGVKTSSKYLTYEEIKQIAARFTKLDLSSFLNPGEEKVFTPANSYIGKLDQIPVQAIVVSRHAARLKREIEAEIYQGSLSAGFIFNGIEVLSDQELFGQKQTRSKIKPASQEGVADELLADLKPGDYVVHENYGVALFIGTTKIKIERVEQEYLVLEFAKGDKVYVPPDMAGLVEKYSSGGGYKPKLSRLGTKQWQRTKSRVKKQLKDMTKELLQLYAAREKMPGTAYPPDDIWQDELRATFPFEETPDQKKAIIDVKKDMESVQPMDRLVCGDVGYGKTEVAIRAAAKAAAAGKQVAILVPTTILAEQHYNSFKERFASLPFMVEMLSRFRSKKEQKRVVRDLALGSVDVIIGTHRLLQKDIQFKDLGLLVLDEEQRFGVTHKEKLKKLKQNIDVLTLSATPIPRTLYLSLSGVRSMSTIHTPPVDRSPIRTYVLPWNKTVIREAILRELDRGGQVYFLHNYVETIEATASKIKKLVPEAKVMVAHGQMPGKTLENRMIEFLDKKYDVLVCTSIIESGLDITNVNTIIIDQANNFGLSQLYQIRGRVGRSPVRAYAYLFYHPAKVMSDHALERLKAIQEFTALGSGYKIAMRDLEIRGAGNLLGAEQSGHIMEVGFDLYCELLEQAVREVKGIKEATPREVIIDLKINAYIPQKYISDDRQRIAMYRRLNLVSRKEVLNQLKQELRDRFGPIPEALKELLAIVALRIKALKSQVKSVKVENNQLEIEWLSGKYKKIKLEGQNRLKLAWQYIV